MEIWQPFDALPSTTAAAGLVPAKSRPVPPAPRDAAARPQHRGRRGLLRERGARQRRQRKRPGQELIHDMVTKAIFTVEFLVLNLTKVGGGAIPTYTGSV